MTNAQINSGSRSILAKLLAEEDISVRHSAAVTTAHFQLENRVLMLPIWQDISPELYDMLVIHEVGHALETPMEAWINAIDDIAKRCSKNPDSARKGVKDFLNVVEDPRIDKLQMRRYPGSRRDYSIGYQELHERDFFSLKLIKEKTGRSVNDLDFIDRANIYWKGGKSLGIKFSKVEKAFLERIGNTETFADVVALAEEIYVWARKNKKEKKAKKPKDILDALKDLQEEMENLQPDEIPQDFEPDEDEDEVEDEAEADEADDAEESDEDDPEVDEPEDNAFEDTITADDLDEEDEDSSDGEESDEADDLEDDSDPKSLTEQAATDNAGQLLGKGNVDYSYAQTPKMNLENIIDDYKKVLAEQTADYERRYTDQTGYWNDKGYFARQHEVADAELIKFRQAENPTISYMVKEFEMRKAAAMYSRSAQSKTGILDTNKLHSYRYNDDVFKKLTVIPEGKNHGFVMFLDWSGSMHGNLQDTVKQLLSLVWFCKRVSIPFEVYTFRNEKGDLEQKDQFSMEHGDLTPSTFKLRNILSSRMNVQDFQKAVRFIWLQSYRPFNCDPMGSTPLYQSMMVSARIVNDFRRKHGVEVVNTIFLTDGEGDGLSRPQGDLSFGSYGSFGTRKELLITDSVTKKVYKVNGLGRTDVQRTFLQMLKDQTGSNVIGFFLTNDTFRGISQKYKVYGDSTQSSSYRKNGFFAAKDVGYDEFYVINPRVLAGRDNEVMKVTSSQTKAAAKKEFLRSLTQKNNNRILLKMFMKQVCTSA